MKLKIFITILSLAIIVTSANAQWFENGQPAKETPWTKSWGDYGATLLLTDKPNQLFSTWGKKKGGIQISTTKVAKRGQPVVGVIIFAGCSKDQNGLCNSTAIFQVFKPDGLPYGKEEPGELWIGKPPPSYGELQLSIGAIGFRIEPQDPNGIYTVRARLLDKISRDEVELKQTFQVFPEK